jgi:hypothetical protein
MKFELREVIVVEKFYLRNAIIKARQTIRNIELEPNYSLIRR